MHVQKKTISNLMSLLPNTYRSAECICGIVYICIYIYTPIYIHVYIHMYIYIWISDGYVCGRQ